MKFCPPAAACHYKLITVVVSCTRSGQLKQREAPPLGKELLEVDSCWGKERHFSSGAWPLVARPPGDGPTSVKTR